MKGGTLIGIQIVINMLISLSDIQNDLSFSKKVLININTCGTRLTRNIPYKEI